MVIAVALVIWATDGGAGVSSGQSHVDGIPVRTAHLGGAAFTEQFCEVTETQTGSCSDQQSSFEIKKTVRTGFLDFTRERRQRVCYREVELNRRLAPDVYHGVAGPTGRPGNTS
jgi:hypothetical protein